MKKFILFISLLFLTSCGSSEGLRFNTQTVQKIKDSYTIWNSRKIEYASYSYTVSDSSKDEYHVLNWKTAIYVEDEKVTCRYFQSVNDLSASLWLEMDILNDLNKHNEGAPVKTLSNLYNECYLLALTDWDSTLQFSVFDNGLLKTCYFENSEYPDYDKIKIESISMSKCFLSKK